ncbi:MAG: lipoyl(octanoyl) transferase LipB [Bacteroidetes bacterium]|nr:lipoyl(octanoyl) transferase LipB [Bacteroidota bacterium]
MIDLSLQFRMNTILFHDLGEIEYGKAWDLQEKLMQKGLHIKAERYNNPTNEDEPLTQNFLLFCKHPPVYTLGKSGHLENLLVSDSRLKELHVSFYKTNRGGDITYHGPGQIVGYPILDLEYFFTDLGKYMRSLEEVIIRVLKSYDVEAGRLPGSTGVWLEAKTPRARKICAMGVRCSRWITIHGFALNVNTDLKYFDYIVPCGIKDKSVTSLAVELGHVVDEVEVAARLRYEFSQVFEANIVSYNKLFDEF